MGIILFNFRKRCKQFVTKDMYPSDLEELDKLENQPEIMSQRYVQEFISDSFKRNIS